MARFQRTFFTLSCVAAIACTTTYRKPRPDLPKSERGMAELSQLLRDLGRAMREDDLDKAEKMAEELQEGIAEADGVTASHPEWADLKRAALRAAEVYEHRQRARAAGELQAVQEAQVARGDRLLEELRTEGPTDDRLDELVGIVEELSERRAEGEEYYDIDAYYEFDVDLEQRLVEYQAEQRRYRWLMAAQKQIEDILDDALGDSDSGMSARVDYLEKNARVYERCHQTIGELAFQPDYAPDLPMRTVLGDLTAGEVGAECATRHEQASRRANEMRWARDTALVATRANAAMEEVQDSGTPLARLSASKKAVDALTECVSGLAGTEEQPGFDPAAKLRSWKGQVSAVALRSMCSEKLERIKADMPMLHWRAGVFELRERVDQAKRDLAAARKKKKKDPARNELIGEALGGFEECQDRVGYLAKRSDPDLAGAEPSKPEWLAIEALRKSCVKQAARASKMR
jgi:hypothetical protein